MNTTIRIAATESNLALILTNLKAAAEPLGLTVNEVTMWWGRGFLKDANGDAIEFNIDSYNGKLKVGGVGYRLSSRGRGRHQLHLRRAVCDAALQLPGQLHRRERETSPQLGCVP